MNTTTAAAATVAASSPAISTSTSTPAPYATLLLIRHGETELNARGILQGSGVDYPLNDVGRAQARQLGERLASARVDLVAASTLHVVPGLEEISWGEFDGKANQNLSPLMDAWNSGDFDARCPGGESAAEVEARALPAIRQLLDEHGGDNRHLAIVIHGRLLRVILSSLLDGVLDRMHTYDHRNTCINQISVYHDPAHRSLPAWTGRRAPSAARQQLAAYRFEAVCLNDTQHLTPLTTPVDPATSAMSPQHS
ncbi:histidine phosphatase superfamily [Syncephalis pseudoplumigaleata]|uniref:Histidine phosphatase superfamily n=1 Tax=Syncephalis pseudoplumigaleata TaxID=1712513 RepID=A0A4P9YZH1_9FUNG|nr:histidine phosphatase superfamily [Syncephalis pseudoplumigaleata]|eukprot:RKP25557.1 histidine phosphatase superfamily [Syncephalis pseudoplumigaleata]